MVVKITDSHTFLIISNLINHSNEKNQNKKEIKQLLFVFQGKNFI